MKEELYFKTKGGDNLVLASLEPSYNFTFNNGNGEVGRMSWGNGEMVFEGKADDAAKVFLDFLKVYIDQYIVSKLGV